MNGIQVVFTARVAQTAKTTVSATGIKRTRIKVDVPITTDTNTGKTSIIWASVTGAGDLCAVLESLAVDDVVYVEGGLRIARYEKNGNREIGLNVTAKYATRVAPDEASTDTHAHARVMADILPTRNGKVASSRRRFCDDEIPY